MLQYYTYLDQESIRLCFKIKAVLAAAAVSEPESARAALEACQERLQFLQETNAVIIWGTIVDLHHDWRPMCRLSLHA